MILYLHFFVEMRTAAKIQEKVHMKVVILRDSQTQRQLPLLFPLSKVESPCEKFTPGHLVTKVGKWNFHCFDCCQVSMKL